MITDTRLLSVIYNGWSNDNDREMRMSMTTGIIIVIITITINCILLTSKQDTNHVFDAAWIHQRQLYFCSPFHRVGEVYSVVWKINNAANGAASENTQILCFQLRRHIFHIFVIKGDEISNC